MSVVLLLPYEASMGEEWLSALPTGCAEGQITHPELQSSHHLSSWKLSKKRFFFFKCWDSSSPDQALSSSGNSPLLFLTGTKWQVSPARSPSCDRWSCSCPTTCDPKSWKQEKQNHRSARSPAQPEGAAREVTQGGLCTRHLGRGRGTGTRTTNRFRGVLSLTDWSFGTQLLSAQPTHG